MDFDQKHFGNFLNVFGFGQEISTELSKKHSTFPYECLMIFFWKSYISLTLSDYGQKTIQRLAEKKSASLSKMQSGCPRENFERKTTFLEEKLYVPLHRFWTTGHTFSELWRKYSSTVVPTALHSYMGGVWAKLVYLRKKTIFIFKNLVEKSGLLSKKQQTRQNCILDVLRNVLRKNIFL